MPGIVGLALWFAATFVFLWIAVNSGAWLAWGLCLGCLGVALWFASGAAAARAAHRIDRVRAALQSGEATAQVVASRAGLPARSVRAALATLERGGDVTAGLRAEMVQGEPRLFYALTRAGRTRAGNTPTPVRLGRH